MIPQLEPLKYGEQPYDWTLATARQCTWYCYFRFYQVFGAFPVYNNRKLKKEGYNNGKTWLDNYKDATPHWFKDEPNIEFKQGDVIVFDGNYGHVAFVEVTDGYDKDHCLVSNYNLIAPEAFSTDVFERGHILYGSPYNTGKPIGLLRYETVTPVDRNENVNQVYVNEPTLRVRLAPNLSGEYYCNCPTGYFNVLSQSEADNYTWYQIQEGKYIADIGYDNDNKTGVLFLPAIDNQLELLQKENKELKETLKTINELSEVDE